MWFHIFMDRKIAENAVIYIKFLYIMYLQYKIFVRHAVGEILSLCYLKRCQDIPVQNFGNHIHIQYAPSHPD